VISLIFRIKGCASCSSSFKACKVLTMAVIYVFVKEYHMNIKYIYHVHEYDTRGIHDLRVSDCGSSAYQNGVFNMDIKSYSKLPEKIKRLHSVILKRVEISTFAERFVYCRGICTGSIVVAVCFGSWVNKRNYPYARNFIYCFSHVVAFGCGMFVFDLCILFVC
jgi:hypothetical protein